MSPYRVYGDHYIANCHDVDPDLASDELYLRKLVKEAIDIADMHLVEMKSWRFEGEGGGVSIYALIVESHVSIHTWPNQRFVTIDVYTCGLEKKAREAIEHIIYGLGGDCVMSYVNRSQ